MFLFVQNGLEIPILIIPVMEISRCRKRSAYKNAHLTIAFYYTEKKQMKCSIIGKLKYGIYIVVISFQKMLTGMGKYL